jgi:hypothetical protein
MTEHVQITIALANTVNQVIELEQHIPVGGFPLPNPAKIIRFIMWDENHGTAPYSSHGNSTFALDPNKYYINSSGFPATQTALPKTLITFGFFRFWPGKNENFIDATFAQPILYRPGDAIIVGPQGGSAADSLRLFLGFCLATERELLPR